MTNGYPVDLKSLSVAEENLLLNYDDSESASVIFELSNKNELTLFFPEPEACYLIPGNHGRPVLSLSAFRSNFNCPIGFVPILGPVEHNEPLYEKEAARLALFNYRAARNFRNIWYHYPQKFIDFRSTLAQTWPNMDIELPTRDASHEKPRLHMFCLEDRITREIFWSGFGFQVWCQLLTHLIQSSDKALFLIDEPDIYLHADLQRQLLSLLRSLGPDVLVATHSTEIITEAEADDIVLINKSRKSARRITNPSQLGEIFSILGSSLNPVLTQLAKTRRVVFVEGKDFRLIGKFASKLGISNVENRSRFAVVPIGGFNPERIRSLKSGMETAVGSAINAVVVLDKDYRSRGECEDIRRECESLCDHFVIHNRKEIENFLIVPDAIDRAVTGKLADRAKRNGSKGATYRDAEGVLEKFSLTKKAYVTSQYVGCRTRHERKNSSSRSQESIAEDVIADIEDLWSDGSERLKIIPGKEAIGEVNRDLQNRYNVSITATAR